MARKRKFVPTSEWSDRMPWPVATVLGIDASMTSTGWSVVTFQPLRRPFVVARGNVRTEPTGDKSIKDTIQRSGIIFAGMEAVVRTMLSLTHVSIECPTAAAFSTNGQARAESGPVMASACYNAVRIHYPYISINLYQPSSVKKSVAGNGRAEKPEVKSAVFEWLGEEFRTNADISDSIAAAIHDMLQLTGVPDDY